MALLRDKIKQTPKSIIISVMKREKKSATMLAEEMNISGQALRKRLRGDSKFSVDEFMDILDRLGYKINVVKETDII